MADAMLEVRQALVARLTGDATLMAMITGVFDWAPPDQPFPFLELAGASEGLDDKTISGMRHELEIHAWSSGRGAKEAIEILGRVRELLHRQPLVLTSHVVVQPPRETGRTVLQDVDPERWHGIARYELTTQPM